MDGYLEGIMLSEISQRNMIWHRLYVRSKKYNKLVNVIKRSRLTEQTSGYQWGGQNRIGNKSKLLHINYKDILYSTWVIANFYNNYPSKVTFNIV